LLPPRASESVFCFKNPLEATFHTNSKAQQYSSSSTSSRWRDNNATTSPETLTNRHKSWESLCLCLSPPQRDTHGCKKTKETGTQLDSICGWVRSITTTTTTQESTQEAAASKHNHNQQQHNNQVE
jgi:hypothetical protein